jgi:hypothetical protein
MKTTITAFALCLSMFGLGCGVPVEEGSAEDVEAQQQEVLAVPGFCQAILKKGKWVENGLCVSNDLSCIRAGSASCISGRVASSPSMLDLCGLFVSTTPCQ